MLKRYQVEYFSILILIVISIIMNTYFYLPSMIYLLGAFFNLAGLLLFGLGKLTLRENWHNI